jgi:hypothetical protein
MLTVSLLCSCEFVFTKQPISDTSDPRDIKELEGAWLTLGKRPEILLIAFDNKGIANMVSPMWDVTSQRFTFSSYAKFIITRFEETRYISFRVDDESELYFLIQGAIQENHFSMCFADFDQFKKAIDDKELSGEMDLDELIITSTRDELGQFLIKNENRPLFDCENSIKIKKISDISRTSAFAELDLKTLRIPESDMKTSSQHVFEGCKGSWEEIKKCAEEKRGKISQP